MKGNTFQNTKYAKRIHWYFWSSLLPGMGLWKSQAKSMDVMGGLHQHMFQIHCREHGYKSELCKFLH